MAKMVLGMLNCIRILLVAHEIWRQGDYHQHFQRRTCDCHEGLAGLPMMVTVCVRRWSRLRPSLGHVRKLPMWIEDRDHQVRFTEVYICRMKRGVTQSIKQKLKRRSGIEPIIGNIQGDGCLDLCTLKGQLGDAMFAVLCSCDHNLRLILNYYRVTASKFYWALV